MMTHNREELFRAVRQMGSNNVFFHQVLAERVGLNATDSRCIGVLWNKGPATAGELAKVTGLTTGAVTRVIDRLSAKGFVRRESDPKDRRKVLVVFEPESNVSREFAGLFSSLTARFTELLGHYTFEEQNVIFRYSNDCAKMFLEETEKISKLNDTQELQ